ncbi:MAG: TM0106 family RecB-like putative nuclease [Candidatus Uhrbacteria bacterium]
MSLQIVTPSLFYQYATCPHWIWYDHFGDQSRKEKPAALAEKLLEQGVMHEEEYVKGLIGDGFIEVSTKDQAKAFAKTVELMRQGVATIYQGSIEATVDGVFWRGRPDLLEKRKGKSKLGLHFYVPVDIKSSHSIHKEQQLQLTFYAKILEEIQGVRPRETAIINVDHERIAFAPGSEHLVKAKKITKEIVEVLNGKKPPLRLASKCKHSPWFKECIRSAEEANDIALIYDLDARAHPALRKAGIETVADAAKMVVARLPKIPHCSPAELDRIKLQAQSLATNNLHWLKKPSIPDAPIRIYFDIEGDPLLDVQYLFGFWIEGDGKPRYEYFLAEKPEHEARMWREFVDWTATLKPGTFKVYHYADYERAQTLRLAKEHGSSPAFEYFASQYVDLLAIVRESVIFPLYFYSIKDIAKSKFLNFKWRSKKAGGAQSIFWYEEWLETKDRRILQDVIDYNEDDVLATACLDKWLRTVGK